MFDLPQRALDVAEQVENFFQQRVLPNNKLWSNRPAPGRPYQKFSKRCARRQKPWAYGIWHCLGWPRTNRACLSNLEFTAVAEILGCLEWGSHVFNCNAPDVPNMELLQLFGSDEQKQQWLQPLLEGEIGSAFAMTEPHAASSDPANLETRIEQDGDEFVVNGRKWFASNGSHANCELLILVGVTNPEGQKSQRQSLLLIPRHTPGINVIRNLPVFDHFSETNLHPELEFNNVRVPTSNLLGDAGAGFAIGQARLGPARLHHCMRAIGECEVLISLMVRRSQSRSTFGKRIDEYSSTQAAISLSRIELDQCRLLVQKAAHLLDTVGNKAARKEISMIKVAVAKVYQDIADRCIQLHGARGVTGDTPAAWASARQEPSHLRRTDEVHLQTIARLEANEQSLAGLEHYLHE